MHAHGNISLLEHVNLDVPDIAVARVFYVDGLGFAVDPRIPELISVVRQRQIWFNCGLGQVHVGHVPTPQRIDGSIGLLYPSLEELRERLQTPSLSEALSGTQFAWRAADMVDLPLPKCLHQYGTMVIEVTDPWGNVWRCHESGVGCDRSWWVVAGAHPGAASVPCGLWYFQHRVPRHAARAIGACYRRFFGAQTTLCKEFGELECAVIRAGPEQLLVFEECEDTPSSYDGHHICVYLHEYESAFKALHAAGLVYVNEKYSDRVTTLQDAIESKQFRFRDYLDWPAGSIATSNAEAAVVRHQLEHEVRSADHLCNPLGRSKSEADRIGRSVHRNRLAGLTGPAANL